MATKQTVSVPDLGDFSDVEVIEVLVKPGDTVQAEDPLLTLETDKAAMDVPSPHAGKIISVGVKEGDKVNQGDPILEIEASLGAEPTVEVPGVKSTLPDQRPPTETMIIPKVESNAPPAPSDIEVKVPDIGDFDSVEVIEVLVNIGQDVVQEQPLITLESDKAAMDIPSTAAGKIATLYVKAGDKVGEGDRIALLTGATVAKDFGMDVAPHETVVIPADPPAPQPAAAPAAQPATTGGTLPAIDETSFGKAHASPRIRKLARELGVNLGQVRGSGVKVRITEADVKAFVKAILTGQAAPAAAALPKVPSVDFAKYGEIETRKLTRIQRISGPRLHASWVNLPHVTQFDEADFSDTESRRKAMKAQALEQGVKLSPLAFVMRACVIALQEFPAMNSSLSEDGKELVLKHYISLGFAADTEDGLVVPVIHNAQKLPLLELARQTSDLAERARDGKLKAADMSGGTFTISSLGGIGGTAFTPVINAPEVAILGVSRSAYKPIYRSGEFVPRLMLPLSLSYDHRVIDGAQAARFTTRLSALLADPDTLIAKPDAGESA